MINSFIHFRSQAVRIALLVCSLWLACQSSPLAGDDSSAIPQLNSERIAERYGSYGVRVLEQMGSMRVASLYSLEDGAEVCRTLAVTEFVEPVPAALTGEFAEIAGGASIGSTLKAAGWEVEKRHGLITSMEAGGQFRRLAGLPPAGDGPRVAVHLYELWAVKDAQEFRLAAIAEAHHPDYLDLHGLRALDPAAAAPGTGAEFRYLRLLVSLSAALDGEAQSR